MTEAVPIEETEAVTETQSSTSPPCSEGTEEHKKAMRAVQSHTGRGTDRTLHACGASAVVLDAGP